MNPFPKHKRSLINKGITLLTCFIFSILCIIALYYASDILNHRPNGFTRLFPPHVVSIKKSIDLQYNSFYLAGATSSHLYLGNRTNPYLLLVTNYQLTDTQILILRPEHKFEHLKGNGLFAVDSPRIYFIEGKTPLLLETTYPSLSLRQIRESPVYSIGTIPLSTTSLGLRMYDDKNGQIILAKENLNPPLIDKKQDVLQNQGDGIFSVDGTLLFDNVSKNLIFVYYYRNQFIRLDSNLNVIYRARTVDTNTVAKLNIASIQSEGVTVLGSPPLQVNKQASVSNNRIYVHSLLMANNEDKAEFETSSVLDIYNLGNGKYKYSFYLPDIKSKNLTILLVFNMSLFVVHDQYLSIYQINW
jgi:hypothetical protein